MNKKLIIGLLGVVLLVIGVFAPIYSATQFLTLTIFKNSDWLTYLLLGLSAASLVIVLKNQFKLLYITGGCAFITVFIKFYEIKSASDEALLSAKSAMGFQQYSNFNQALLGSIGLEWGWAFLFAGPALLIATAIIKDESDEEKTPQYKYNIVSRSIQCKKCGQGYEGKFTDGKYLAEPAECPNCGEIVTELTINSAGIEAPQVADSISSHKIICPKCNNKLLVEMFKGKFLQKESCTKCGKALDEKNITFSD